MEVWLQIEISLTDSIDTEEVLRLYRANEWSSAEKPDQLMAALRNSHSLVTARASGELVGIGNAISDGILLCISRTYWCCRNFREEAWGGK